MAAKIVGTTADGESFTVPLLDGISYEDAAAVLVEVGERPEVLDASLVGEWPEVDA